MAIEEHIIPFARMEPHADGELLHATAERIKKPCEALLFVASEPLSTKSIAKLVGEDEKAVALALQALEAEYAQRGIVVREAGGGYRFATASETRSAVEAYLLPPKATLSPQAMETLAIVAHLQPVTKSEIESIRGVNSDSVVATLLDRNLIAEGGRKEVVGRPVLYETTQFFLESFGLRSLDDLPPLEVERAELERNAVP